MTHPDPTTSDDISAARWIVTHADDFSDIPEARFDAWLCLKAARRQSSTADHHVRLLRLQREIDLGAQALAQHAADHAARMQRIEAARQAATPTPATHIPAPLVTPARLQIRHVVEQTTGILTGIGLTAALAWVCLVGIPAAAQMLAAS